jgi:hypothetical protein
MRTLPLNRWKSSEGWPSLQASANGASSSANSLARCLAPQLGKLHHTSPKPNAVFVFEPHEHGGTAVHDPE